MAKVDTSAVINRPVEQVFAFVTNLENNKKWQAGLVETVLLEEGPLRLGTRLKDVRQFLGQRIESIAEVTEYKPNREFGFRVASGPIPFHGQMSFEAAEGSTRITFVGEGEPGGLFKLLEPIVVSAFQKRIEENYARLKSILEG